MKYALWLAQTITKRAVVIRITYNQYNQQINSTIIASQIEGESINEDYNPDLISCSLEYRIPPDNTAEIAPETILSELLSKIQDQFYPPTTPAQVSAIVVELGEKDNGFLPPPAIFYLLSVYCAINTGFYLS